LLGKAQAEGVELLGPGGLLSQVNKAAVERVLAGEMSVHLGYEKHGLPARGSGNSRDGITPKTVFTQLGRWTWQHQWDCPGSIGQLGRGPAQQWGANTRLQDGRGCSQSP
jgi:putative transposase